MISAIVLVPGGPSRGGAREGELLVRSLVWLVSAVVSGIIRDVTLAGPPGLDLAEIADQSGCAAVEAEDESVRLAHAVASSKQPRLLILKSGYQPGDGMTGELDSMARVVAARESAKILAAPASFLPRVFPGLGQPVGLFAPASLCRDLRGRDFAGLKSGLSPKITFATRATPIL